MMRRVITLRVEIEGERPDAERLRRAVEDVAWYRHWKVNRCEVLAEEDPRG